MTIILMMMMVMEIKMLTMRTIMKIMMVVLAHLRKSCSLIQLMGHDLQIPLGKDKGRWKLWIHNSEMMRLDG